MAAPITLGITIRADGSAQVTGELNRVRDSVANAGNAAQNSSRQFAEMAGKLKALVGIGFATAMATEIFKVNREMQSLRTSLETVTGSAANAQAAFKQIQSFAASTPYSVKEVTDAFVKLSTFGLRAGESDLTSYGNTAGAMGKSLNQLVEAVADAVTGEFERLKEFGIKTSAHGDKVTFTFKGIETTVKNSSTAIQDYLKHIGDIDFAGGMARQAKTIDGAMSNLGDSWNNLLDTLITTAGEEWIAGLISGLSDVINSVGNVGKEMASFGGITASTGAYIEATWMTISETAIAAMQSVLVSFPWLPEAAKTALQFTAEVFKSAFEIIRLLGVGLVNGIVGGFNAMGTAIGMAAAGIVEVFSQAFTRIKDMGSGLALGIEAAMAGDLSFGLFNAALGRETLSFKQVATDINASVKTAFNTDYAKDFGDKIKAHAKEIGAVQDGADKSTVSLDKFSTATKDSATSSKEAAAAAKKAATEEASRRKEVAKTTEELQFELVANRMSVADKTLQTELHNKLAKAVGAERDQITALVTQINTETVARDLQKKSTDAAKTEMDSLIDKYNQLTMSAEDYFAAKLKAAGVTTTDAAPLIAQNKKNTTIELDQAKIQEARSALQDYNKTATDTTKQMQDLASVSSSVFDGALGGVNAMTGAFANMVSSIQDNTNALMDLGAQKTTMDRFQPDASKGFTQEYINDVKLKASAESKYEADVLALNSKVTASKLSGSRQIAGAVSGMLKQGSTEQRAAHAIEMGLAGVQLAMQLMKILGIGAVTAAETASVAPAVTAATTKSEANALEAITSQAGAGPYIGFALMAAMAIAMAALGFGKGKSGAVTAPPPTSPDTGTVLGDKTAKSQSVNNTYQLLKDIHASEYAELRGINSGVAALSSGITNVITKLFQAGGLNPNITLVPTFSTLPGGNKMGSPIHQWIVSGLFGGTQKQEQTGAGIATGATSLSSIRAGSNLSAQQYATIKTTTDGGWFGKDKVSYSNQYAALDAETQKALNVIFKSVGDTMFGLAKNLGGDLTKKVNDYVIPAMTVELKGLSGKDAAEKLIGVISTALDTMSMSVFGSMLAQYQQLGEGMLETTTRIVAEMAVVKDALTLSGLSLKKNVIAVTDAIVQSAGGLKEYQKNFENYFDKFYSDGEKTTRTYNQLSSALAEVGLKVAATRQGYRAQIQALNLNNALDQQRYSLLISLSEAADSYYSSLEKVADSMKLMTEDNFKTAFEYKRYLSQASLAGITEAQNLMGWSNKTFEPTAKSPVINLPVTQAPASANQDVSVVLNTVADSTDKVAAQIAALRAEQKAQALAIAQNTADTAKIIRRWDGDGMPATRTTV